jgi:hypothetical protein
LFDAYHVPKPLSQQLLQFGRSGDGFKVLTFEVEQFSALSARRGQSASVWRTVCGLAVHRVFFVFLLAFVFDPLCFRVLVGEVSDGPRVPGGQSAGAWRTVRVLPADGPLFGVATGGSVCFFGQSAAQGRTVRGAGVDSPRQQAGQSAWPVRTVRPSWPDGPPEPDCFALWFDSSLLSFVLPRVLQGIAPKT